jgi:endonuclease YncB( thermonuclease family)
MSNRKIAEELIKKMNEAKESKPNFKNEKEWTEARIKALKRNLGIEE